MSYHSPPQTYADHTALAEFVATHCELATANRVPINDLWAAWHDWADQRRAWAGSVNRFLPDLHTIDPRITVYRPRDPESKGKLRRHYRGIGFTPAAAERHYAGLPLAAPADLATACDLTGCCAEPATPADVHDCGDLTCKGDH